MEPELLSIEQVAQRLGLSRSKTYELVASGDIATVVVGSTKRVRRRDLEAWVEGLVERPAHQHTEYAINGADVADQRSE